MVANRRDSSTVPEGREIRQRLGKTKWPYHMKLYPSLTLGRICLSDKTNCWPCMPMQKSSCRGETEQSGQKKQHQPWNYYSIIQQKGRNHPFSSDILKDITYCGYLTYINEVGAIMFTRVKKSFRLFSPTIVIFLILRFFTWLFSYGLK